MEAPLLETENLILRSISLDDAPAIQKYFNNWNVIKNLSTVVPWPYPEDGAKEFITKIALPKIAADKAIIWVITERKADYGEAIGVIDYRTEETHDGNRGFWLAEPFWGRGYMTEAVTAMQDYIFFNLGVERIVVLNAIANKGSYRVKEKTGAKFIGMAQLAHHEGGTDAEKWEVTCENWSRIRGDKT